MGCVGRPLDGLTADFLLTRYMTESGHRVTRALFEQTDRHEKLARDVFRDDMLPLLRPEVSWSRGGAGGASPRSNGSGSRAGSESSVTV